MDVEQVVVISLARRTDRRARFNRGLPAKWALPAPVFVDAAEGGQAGCRASHLQVLRSALGDAVGSLLVLEDDALFVDNFVARWPWFTHLLPADWQMLMLGGQHYRPPLPVRPGIVRCVDVQRTHAYLVRPAAMRALSQVWARGSGRLDAQLHEVQARVPVYAPQPFLVGQAAGRSDISGRQEPARFW